MGSCSSAPAGGGRPPAGLCWRHRRPPPVTAAGTDWTARAGVDVVIWRRGCGPWSWRRRWRWRCFWRRCCCYCCCCCCCCRCRRQLLGPPAPVGGRRRRASNGRQRVGWRAWRPDLAWIHRRAPPHLHLPLLLHASPCLALPRPPGSLLGPSDLIS